MAMTRMLPVRATLRRPRLRWVDLVVGGAILVVLGLVLRVGQDMDVPFVPSNVGPTISTDPGNIPFYAACSLLRMFVALAASLVFTFIYATVAARSKRAEKAMIPVLDILQSVPVLGFLSITVTAFIALFPGSALGLECASIFAIFTAMAWNMAFAFYYSLRSQPETARRSRPAHAADPLAALLEARCAERDGAADLERHVELRRRLVLPCRVRDHQRAQSPVRPAWNRQLRCHGVE